MSVLVLYGCNAGGRDYEARTRECEDDMRRVGQSKGLGRMQESLCRGWVKGRMIGSIGLIGL